ncbi:hypothetical protein ACPXAM_24020, partial [Escherichia coli]|uniref:hypothetical protein n=1 Tax=Escherichia coli TaxID=562 RepID=UPI003CE4CFB1
DAATAARSVTCSAFFEQMRTHMGAPQLSLTGDAIPGLGNGKIAGLANKATGFLSSQGETAGYGALSAFCMGQETTGAGLDIST